MDTLDTFNVICGIITIASFVFALIIYIRNKDLKRSLESNVIALIGILDKLSDLEENPEVTKKALALGITNARDQAIGILHIFSEADKRHKTFDFGIDGDTYEEKLEKRREKTGSRGGCILYGQAVLTPYGSITVDNIKVGQIISGFDFNENKVVKNKVLGVKKFKSESHIDINRIIKVTPHHQIYFTEDGWKPACKATIGDHILSSKAKKRTINALIHKRGSHPVYEIQTSTKNLFVNDILVHNVKP